jgi:hypothetical protein
MTKRDKIRILKKALKILEQKHANGYYKTGICNNLWHASNYLYKDAALFGIELPERRYGYYRSYCWPLNARGAAIRRRVLKNAIKRLQKKN